MYQSYATIISKKLLDFLGHWTINIMKFFIGTFYMRYNPLQNFIVKISANLDIKEGKVDTNSQNYLLVLYLLILVDTHKHIRQF